MGPKESAEPQYCTLHNDLILSITGVRRLGQLLVRKKNLDPRRGARNIRISEDGIYQKVNSNVRLEETIPAVYTITREEPHFVIIIYHKKEKNQFKTAFYKERD